MGNAGDRDNGWWKSPKKDAEDKAAAENAASGEKSPNGTPVEAMSPQASTKTKKNSNDPYGQTSVATQSMRRRGSVDQQRVGVDTRVRNDVNSGTAGAGGTGMAEALGAPTDMQAAQQQQQQQGQQQTLWTAQRQPTDIGSIQSRVLQNLRNLTTGGM